MRQQSTLAHLLVSAAVTAILVGGLGGCQTMSDVTGSITSKAEASPSADADPRQAGEAYGERYRAEPKKAHPAPRYWQALRATAPTAPARSPREQSTPCPPPAPARL